MKTFFRKLSQRVGSALCETLGRELREEIASLRGALTSAQHTSAKHVFSSGSQASQLALLHHYRELARQGKPPLAFSDVGFRCHSQFEEDGILLYIFGLIGTTNRVAVEMCAGQGIECNTANLIINHGWWGYLFDGNEELVNRGREFFRTHPDTFLHPPRFNRAWITAENVNELLTSAGVTGPVDLLSLDLDGVDYWIWKNLDVIAPRVVVCETHNVIPADRSLTIPYDPNFICHDPEFMGASLAAMTKLARAKGYRLVGTHRYGFNAFFIREGEGDALLPEVSVASCLNDLCSRSCREEHWPRVKNMGWVEV